MEEKLQRLATKMVGLFPNKEFSNPQECFDLFKDIYIIQSDYFRNFKPSNLIKLIFYIYSFKNTGNFKLGESLINKLSFASLFITHGNKQLLTCHECGGDGEVRCNNCKTDGKIQCDVCGGDGDLECGYCNGNGNIADDTECPECHGSGAQTCDNCEGSGELDCEECSNGYVRCENCDGDGEVETDELIYEYYSICTWNNFIKTECDINSNTLNPALSEYDFDRLRGDYIILKYDENSIEFVDEVEYNEVYCTFYGDEPELRLNSKQLTFSIMDENMSLYTT